MRTTKLISLLLLLQFTNGSRIKIQIDSDDVLKLVDTLMKSKIFRDVAAEIVKRPESKKGVYNNPYHPEDDVIVINDSKELKQTKKQQTSTTKSMNDINMEKDNENYILDKGPKSEEQLDMLEELETLEPTSRPTTTHVSTTKVKKNKKHKNNNFADPDNRHFKILQRRFQLKSS